MQSTDKKRSKTKTAQEPPKVSLPKHGYPIQSIVLLEDSTLYITLCPLGRLCGVLEESQNEDSSFNLEESSDYKQENYPKNTVSINGGLIVLHVDGNLSVYKSQNKEEENFEAYPAIKYKEFLQSPYDFLKSIDCFYTASDNAFHAESVIGIKKLDALLNYIEQSDEMIRTDYTNILSIASKASSFKEDTLINASTNGLVAYTSNAQKLQQLHKELFNALTEYKTKSQDILVHINEILDIHHQNIQVEPDKQIYVEPQVIVVVPVEEDEEKPAKVPKPKAPRSKTPAKKSTK
jgi:hypothetical protein